MQITTNKRTWFILIFSILFISVLVMYSLQGFSTHTHVITHQIDFDIIAGNSKCFHEQILNNRDYPVIITEFIHTDIEGITSSIHEVDSSGSEVIPGEEMQPPITINANENFSFFICYHTNAALSPGSYNLVTKFFMEETEDPIDDTPPNVSMVKPEENSLYVFNRKIHSNFCCKTMILGPIDIIVEAIDESGAGIDYVEFYINNNLVENITEESSDSLYAYRWSSFAFGCYTIRIDAFDSLGNSASESMNVFKLF
jgi:hypothetical protein